MTMIGKTPTGIEALQAVWRRTPRAAGYVRQAFEEMGKERTRLEGQTSRIATCATKHQWPLVDTHEDFCWAKEGLNRPGLVALLLDTEFDVLVVDRTDRLAYKKSDLDFLLALLEEQGVTVVPATWSWEPIAQYMRRWYRGRGNAVYAQLEAETARAA